MFQKRFPFLGERLAVDLLNTVIVQDGAVQDLLLEPGAAGAWAEASGEIARGSGPVDERGLRRFREALRRGLVDWAARGTPSATLVALVNRGMALSSEVSELRLVGGQVTTRRRRTGAASDRLYGAVARSAADLLQHGDPHRLRKCANPACRLMFYDVSKAGRRRWCSMQRCGGQAKARAFRRRASRGHPPTTSRRQSG
ncbi:MAG TPA: CGNR zinc finger domain-containing protein [Gemmatimonadales bacterium]|nr:CGNR zinc finger domain-containing protein [Gemmatimonadales bacterium]